MISLLEHGSKSWWAAQEKLIGTEVTEPMQRCRPFHVTKRAGDNPIRGRPSRGPIIEVFREIAHLKTTLDRTAMTWESIATREDMLDSQCSARQREASNARSRFWHTQLAVTAWMEPLELVT